MLQGLHSLFYSIPLPWNAGPCLRIDILQFDGLNWCFANFSAHKESYGDLIKTNCWAPLSMVLIPRISSGPWDFAS